MEANATFPFVAPVKVATAGEGAKIPAVMSRKPITNSARAPAGIALRSAKGELAIFTHPPSPYRLPPRDPSRPWAHDFSAVWRTFRPILEETSGSINRRCADKFLRHQQFIFRSHSVRTRHPGP